jgi:hypothetical protein
VALFVGITHVGDADTEAVLGALKAAGGPRSIGELALILRRPAYVVAGAINDLEQLELVRPSRDSGPLQYAAAGPSKRKADSKHMTPPAVRAPVRDTWGSTRK